jgi:hypothetical protein
MLGEEAIGYGNVIGFPSKADKRKMALFIWLQTTAMETVETVWTLGWRAMLGEEAIGYGINVIGFPRKLTKGRWHCSFGSRRLLWRLWTLRWKAMLVCWQHSILRTVFFSPQKTIGTIRAFQ